jgi:hypothetical protein
MVVDWAVKLHTGTHHLDICRDSIGSLRPQALTTLSRGSRNTPLESTMS